MSTPTFQLIPLSAIIESDFNPRKHFDASKLAELAESIKTNGVHTPILVRPLPGRRVPDTGKGITHEIVAGARRFRASQLAGQEAIPAVVRDMDDNAALEAAIVENLQREDLSELDEAEGYDALMRHSSINADAVAEKIGKSRSYVYGRLKLMDLRPEARAALRSGLLDASRALLLARIPDAKLQVKALGEIADPNAWNGPMSYRRAAEHVQQRYMLNLSKAKFPIKVADVIPGVVACKACPKRTGANPELFDDVKSADTCTDPTCYSQKEEAHAAAQRALAIANGQTIIDGREARALMPNSWNTSVEGYLRLDDAKDSPTGKPLRTELAKQMAAADIRPVLVANPHKNGELVAVLPATTVADLLKAAGKDKAAKEVSGNADEDARDKRREEEQKAKMALEAAWRWAVLEAAWQKILVESDGHSSGPKLDEVTRYVARRRAEGLNQDDAKKLCKLLDLGKVAPKDGLLDWVRTTPTPGAALLLLVMFSDVAYMHWRSDDDRANEGLFLVAETFGVDRHAIEAQTRANTRAAKASEKKAKSTKSEKPATAIPPAAQAKTRGAATPKGKKSPKTEAPKLSVEDAKTGIAAAMQGMEAGADDGPGTAEAPGGVAAGEKEEQRPTAAAEAQATASTTLAVGVRVLVAEGAETRSRYWGETGTISQQGSNGKWMVTFDDKGTLPRALPAGDLEVIDAAAPQESSSKASASGAGECTAVLAAICAGATVKISTKATNKRWRGKQGTVVKRVGDQWMVNFLVTPLSGEPHRTPCVFDPKDLTVVEAEAAGHAPTPVANESLLDDIGNAILVGARIKVTGDQLTGKWGTVARIDHGNVFVYLDDLAAEYHFQPGELRAMPGLDPRAAWPFSKVPAGATA